MSNGLGAGFAGLMLLGVLVGLAGLLILTAGGTVAFRGRAGTVPRLLRYVSIALLGCVLLVAGFGVLALYDEAATLAVLFVAIVLLPLAAAAIYLRRTTGLDRVDTLATVGMAWSGPFVIGVAVTFGLTVGLGSVLDLAPAASRRRGVIWAATAAGGFVVVIGSVLLGKRLSRSLPYPTPVDRDDGE